jgi:hypothetical protein
VLHGAQQTVQKSWTFQGEEASWLQIHHVKENYNCQRAQTFKLADHEFMPIFFSLEL